MLHPQSRSSLFVVTAHQRPLEWIASVETEPVVTDWDVFVNAFSVALAADSRADVIDVDSDLVLGQIKARLRVDAPPSLAPGMPDEHAARLAAAVCLSAMQRAGDQRLGWTITSSAEPI